MQDLPAGWSWHIGTRADPAERVTLAPGREHADYIAESLAWKKCYKAGKKSPTKTPLLQMRKEKLPTKWT